MTAIHTLQIDVCLIKKHYTYAHTTAHVHINMHIQIISDMLSVIQVLSTGHYILNNFTISIAEL